MKLLTSTLMTKKSIVLLLFTIILLTSCNTFPTTDPQEIAVTYAAQTIQAMNQQHTLEATQTLFAMLTQPIIPTATPTSTLNPTFSLTPSATQIPPTPTKTPTVTSTELRCNWIDFIADITIPDGSEVGAGATFKKTWRLKNAGSCTWTTDYDLMFVSGFSFNTPKRVGLPASVKPGATIDLSLLLVAPTIPGNYTGYFMLVDEKGNRFGAGDDARKSFWVNVIVDPPDEIAYNFATHYCDATWRSSRTNPLPCPGKENQITQGYVVRKANPVREGGGIENERGLITRPDNGKYGYIYGVFPKITVETGDLFKAVVGCEYNSLGCDVTFELRYQLKNGPFQTLASWHEVYEGKMQSVSVDLSDLAGLHVKFILYVKNNGTAINNKALWILPRILR